MLLVAKGKYDLNDYTKKSLTSQRQWYKKGSEQQA